MVPEEEEEGGREDLQKGPYNKACNSNNINIVDRHAQIDVKIGFRDGDGDKVKSGYKTEIGGK